MAKEKEPVKKEKKQYTRMTKEEKKQWDELYEYVKREIMGYDENQSLPRDVVLRLKGLTQGKAMGNNNIKNMANYSYDLILLTFKLNKSNIATGTYGKSFSDERARFRYISAIIENNINDVYLRIKKAKESTEKTESMNIDNITHEGAEYINKTENKVTKRMEELW